MLEFEWNGGSNEGGKQINYFWNDYSSCALQENVELFGGDRSRVTLMGHGKGAVCVNFLMISNAVPTGKGYKKIETKLSTQVLFEQLLNTHLNAPFSGKTKNKTFSHCPFLEQFCFVITKFCWC